MRWARCVVHRLHFVYSSSSIFYYYYSLDAMCRFFRFYRKCKTVFIVLLFGIFAYFAVKKRNAKYATIFAPPCLFPVDVVVAFFVFVCKTSTELSATELLHNRFDNKFLVCFWGDTKRKHAIKIILCCAECHLIRRKIRRKIMSFAFICFTARNVYVCVVFLCVYFGWIYLFICRPHTVYDF